jgi:4-diphosphocytidyl-2-C-methyl-D-erythritol kinase
LESVFVALDFCDTISLKPLQGAKALEITMADEKGELRLPLEENLVYKAVSLFREKTGVFQGLKIRVEKHIPLGGGLGGGSSDAASALLALNTLAGGPLNKAALLETGAALGSDVPFFASGAAAAWVCGRGELIEPLAPPRCYFVLVNPGVQSDTCKAYQLLDLMRSGQRAHESGDCGAWAREFSSMPPRDWAFFNDFLPVLQERENSAYAGVISGLKERGADFAGLSGAGATCFGVFTEKVAAEKAAAALMVAWPFVKVAAPAGREEFTTNSTNKFE